MPTEFRELIEIVGRIWAWEDRGVYLEAYVPSTAMFEPGHDKPVVALGILNEDRLDADDHAWLDAHHLSVLETVEALAGELTIH